MNKGDLLYFWGEDTALMIVAANDDGVRFYDAKDPELSDDGNIITKYATYEQISEVCTYVGSVDDILNFTVNRSNTELPQQVKDTIEEIMNYEEGDLNG